MYFKRHYRIKKVPNEKGFYYIIEKRWLFIFWSPAEYRCSVIEDIELEVHYNTLYEARQAIGLMQKQRPKPEVIEKYYF